MNQKTWTLDQIKQANQNSGRFWWSPNTVKSFRDRTSETVYQGEGGIFFVSSQLNFDKTSRHYSVCQFNPESGAVSYVKGNPNREYPHQIWPTLNQAKAAAKRFASGES